MQHSLQVELLKELLHQLDHGVTADAGGLRKNSASVYTCPEMAAREQQVFFTDHPQIIGLSGDLPEAQWRINVGGFPVYFLFPNVVLNVGPAGRIKRRQRRNLKPCCGYGFAGK